VVRFSARATDFSLLRSAQTGSGTTRPASYSFVAGGNRRSWPPTCIQCGGYQSPPAFSAEVIKECKKPSYLCSTRCDDTCGSDAQRHCNAAKTCLFSFFCLFLRTATRRYCLSSSGDCKYSEDGRHKTCPRVSVTESVD